MPNIFINGYCREWQKCRAGVGVIIEDCFAITGKCAPELKGTARPARGNLFREQRLNHHQAAHQADIHLNILTNFDDISRNFAGMCVRSILVLSCRCVSLGVC